MNLYGIIIKFEVFLSNPSGIKIEAMEAVLWLIKRVYFILTHRVLFDSNACFYKVIKQKQFYQGNNRVSGNVQTIIIFVTLLI